MSGMRASAPSLDLNFDVRPLPMDMHWLQTAQESTVAATMVTASRDPIWTPGANGT
jgi:hypothetical protein